MNEIWKDIEGYEGIYQVSNMGRVKRLARSVVQKNPNPYSDTSVVQPISEKILTTRPTKEGYPLILLRGGKDGKRHGFSVHRLVAKAFIPNPDNLPEVNHKNEIRTDNRADNLEWCTRQYNVHYGNCQEKSNAARVLKPVDQYTKDGTFVAHHDSVSAASKATGICTGTIAGICKGKIRSSHGYTFRYSE